MDHPETRAAGARPPRQSRTGLTSTGARKAGSKTSRTRAREFALQGLYQRLVGRGDVADIDAFTRDLAGFAKSDTLHFDTLLQGCVAQEAALDALILPLLDRKLAELSPETVIALEKALPTPVVKKVESASLWRKSQIRQPLPRKWGQSF